MKLIKRFSDEQNKWAVFLPLRHVTWLMAVKGTITWLLKKFSWHGSPFIHLFTSNQ
jgi:hypothetical protein